MKPAAEKLRLFWMRLTLKNAKIPVIANVTANRMKMLRKLKTKLIEQLYSPVQWEDTVQKMIDLGVTTFIEIGPGKVLSGLVKKINRSVETYSVSDESNMSSSD